MAPPSQRRARPKARSTKEAPGGGGLERGPQPPPPPLHQRPPPHLCTNAPSPPPLHQRPPPPPHLCTNAPPTSAPTPPPPSATSPRDSVPPSGGCGGTWAAEGSQTAEHRTASGGRCTVRHSSAVRQPIHSTGPAALPFGRHSAPNGVP